MSGPVSLPVAPLSSSPLPKHRTPVKKKNLVQEDRAMTPRFEHCVQTQVGITISKFCVMESSRLSVVFLCSPGFIEEF